MKKILPIILILALFTGVAFSSQVAYQKTALTGGTSTSLDGINGSSLNDGDFAFVMVGATLYVYLLDADSGAAESSPGVISPDTNAGTKRWILQAPYGVSAAHNILSATHSDTLAASLAAGDILYANATPKLANLAKGDAAYKVLGMNAADTLPEWQASARSTLTAQGDMLYASGANTLARLAKGTAGQLARMNAGATAPAWSTLTMPDTIAAGSIFAANSANILAEINSTSGTKYLKNAAGTISWDTVSATAAGTDTQVQFNDGGTALGGDAGLTYNKATDALIVAGKIGVNTNEAGLAADAVHRLFVYEATTGGEIPARTVGIKHMLTGSAASGLQSLYSHVYHDSTATQAAGNDVSAASFFLYKGLFNASSRGQTRAAEFGFNDYTNDTTDVGYSVEISTTASYSKTNIHGAVVSSPGAGRIGNGIWLLGTGGYTNGIKYTDTDNSTTLFQVSQTGAVLSNSLTASLPVFTDGSKVLVSKSVADTVTALGLTIGTNTQAYSAKLTDIAALAVTDSNIIVGNGSTWVAESGATARTSLGLGTGDSPTFTSMTASGNITLSTNNGRLYGKDTGGTLRTMAVIDGNNDYYTAESIRYTVFGTSSSDNNPILIRVGGANSQQITAGANDTGGAGYRLLRVPN